MTMRFQPFKLIFIFCNYSERTLYLLLFICLLVVAPNCVYTQEVPDSLRSELTKSNGTEKVDLLNQLSKHYEHTVPDSSLFYANQAEVSAKEMDYTDGVALAILNKGNYYSRIGNYTKAITEYDICIELYNETENKEQQSNAYNNKGNVNRIIGDYDIALDNFLISLRISEEIGNLKGIAYASLNAGLIYSTRLGESETKGLPHFLEALEICKEINDTRCVAYAINNIALVYFELKEYDKALDFHHQSLEMKKEAKDQSGIAS